MRLFLFVTAVLLLPACSSSSSTADAALIVVGDGAPKNACLAYGQGYACQSGTVCSAGFVNKEDLDCAATGNICCGPIGDGGISDANDDVNVFVDAAVFETGPSDAAPTDAVVDSGHDAVVDSGHDATVEGGTGDASSRDASDASSTHDASDAASHDASDSSAEDARDGGGDARPG